MSLFSPFYNQGIIDRFMSLSPDSSRQWGKMDVAQMLAHCVQPMKVAFRETKTKRSLISFLFGKMLKRKYITKGQDFEHNLPTDPSFVQRESRDFIEQRDLLIGYIKRWVKEGETAITTEPHPIFGKMSTEDWDKLMVKHLDHHLRQFNA